MINFSDIINGFGLTGVLLLISFAMLATTYAVSSLVQKFAFGVRHNTGVMRAGFLSALPVGFSGVVAGFLTGLSHSPAVGAVVPAALTFIGLVVVYMISKGRLRAVIAGFVVFVFSADLMVGTFLGSALRTRQDELSRSVDIQKRRAEQEFAIRQYRSALGLPPDPPKSERG
jgi:hypothetical protein